MSDWQIVAPVPERPVAPVDPPSVTVVVACFNAANTVADAVRSALDQTCPPAEVIVCDDGSTDDPGSVLAGFGDRITVIRQENAGAGAARNTAVRAASSEFVAILDADDIYAPRRLEAIGYLAGRRPDLDLVTTDAFVERDGARIGRLFHLSPFETRDQRSAILNTSFLGAWPAVRRARLLELGGYDESLRIAEDWDLWVRMILAGSLAGAVDAPLMTYRRHRGGLTGDSSESHRAAIAMLTRTRSNPALRASERRTLDRSISAKQRRLALEEIDAAIRGGSRAALVSASLRRNVPFRARAAALRAAIRPPRA